MDKEVPEGVAGPSRPRGPEEVPEGAAGPSRPREPEDSGGSGSEMDPEDQEIEMKFFEKLKEMMRARDIQEKGAFTGQDKLEYESYAGRFLEINPPIPIEEESWPEPSDGEVTIGIGKNTPTHESDFMQDLSENEWNHIDELFIEYARLKERSTPQYSVPASTNIKAGKSVSTGGSAKETSGGKKGVNPIKDDAGATSENGNKPTTSFEPPQSTSDSKTEDEENKGKVFDDNYPLSGLPQYFDKIIEIDGERFVQKSPLLCFMRHDVVSMGEEGKESGKQKHTTDSVPSPCEEQSTVSKNKKKRRRTKKTGSDRKQDGDKGAIESDAKELEETLETKDVSDSKDHERGPIEDDAKNKVVKETSEPKDVPDSKGDDKVANESDAKKVEETLETKDKESGKQKHTTDSVPSPCEEQATVSKNKKKRRRSKKTDSDRKQDATESISNIKDASASCSNLGLAKDSDGSSMPEFECDAKNKVVEETLESTGIPGSKDDDKGVIEDDAKNKVVEEISESKEIPDSEDGDKGAIESDAKKFEETLETKDVSDSKDYERGPIEDDAKNKVVKETSEPIDIPDSKGDDKIANESDAKKDEVTLETKDKESGKQKHTTDSVPSPCEEQDTVSKNKKKRKSKKTDSDRNKDATESISNIKDASASCSNLGLAKDSDGSSMPEFECDAKNKVVEETLESTRIPGSKDGDKRAIEDDSKNKVVEETSEPKDVPDSKSDDKVANESDAKKVEETLETEDVSDSKDDEKCPTKDDAKKVEETLDTKDISDSNDDEKCPIEDEKNKVVEETSESKDIPDLKDSEESGEEEPTRLNQEKTAGNTSQTSKSRKKRKKKKTSKK